MPKDEVSEELRVSCTVQRLIYLLYIPSHVLPLLCTVQALLMGGGRPSESLPKEGAKGIKREGRRGTRSN
jgi:hypothetical protein